MGVSGVSYVTKARLESEGGDEDTHSLEFAPPTPISALCLLDFEIVGSMLGLGLSQWWHVG